MNRPLKILFKYPCRGREKLFFESLDSIVNNIRDRENYHISLTIDKDDSILNTPEVMDRINTYPNTSVALGVSESKVNAINRDMPEYDWDIVIAWSNDMFSLLFGFDDIMRDYIRQADPNLEGLYHFPEQDAGAALNVLYMAGKNYYKRFGYIYHDSYKSLFCDNETLCVSQMLGKYHYFNVGGLYIHRNPAYFHHNMERDELFNRQQDLWGVDEANFNERKARNFDLDIANLNNKI